MVVSFVSCPYFLLSILKACPSSIAKAIIWKPLPFLSIIHWHFVSAAHLFRFWSSVLELWLLIWPLNQCGHCILDSTFIGFGPIGCQVFDRSEETSSQCIAIEFPYLLHRPIPFDTWLVVHLWPDDNVWCWGGRQVWGQCHWVRRSFRGWRPPATFIDNILGSDYRYHSLITTRNIWKCDFPLMQWSVVSQDHLPSGTVREQG